jgi:single-strand DNA-binding protein
MNKAIIIGRLDTDAQFNDNFNGDSKCRFKLAVTERWQNKERTELVNISVTGEDAQKMRQASTGDLIFVKGLSKPGSYEKNGETIYYHEVESRRLQIMRAPQEDFDQNEVTLVGRLGSDPKVFKDGKVSAFSMACDDYNGKDQTTRWINVVTFDRLAQSAREYLTKGRLVAVEGKIRTREYEKEGTSRTATSIVADRWTALDANPNKKPREESAPVSHDYTGDIPF